jgi:hypothetical protein
MIAGYRRIAERRGKTKANVAIARKVLTLVYYACATARSDASQRLRQREVRTRPDRELDDRHDPFNLERVV